MRRIVYIIMFFAVCATLFSCKRRPGYVLSKEDLAQVMADMHVGEGYVDMNSMRFTTDSDRLVLRQSILAKHGVTQEKFDTSIVWYGHHIDKYLEVYDRTIEILEKRNRELGNAILQTSINISGDSVEVWPASHYAQFSTKMPSYKVSFDILADENWESGDVYTWRMKMVDEGMRLIRWVIRADYADSTFEMMNTTTSNQEWNQVVFPTDSTRTLQSIKGYFEIQPERNNGGKEIWVDSISLVRKRKNNDFYRYRHQLHDYKKM